MASALSCVAAGAAWCFCTAMGSLMSACCGNDKASTIAPGAASGRKRSVLLLVLSIAIAFAFQYFVADFITTISLSNYITDAWRQGCDDKYETELYIQRCAGQAAVYRSSASSTLFFVLAAIGVACKRTANREAWPAKYVLFLFLVLGTCFIPNDPIFLSVYLNIARVGAVFFIFVQQIVLVDLAYNWNDSWVGRADKAESEERGSGGKWLAAILVSAGTMFLASIIGISLLYHFFSGCSNNNTFISVTLIMCLIITGTQLSGEEGSLLASSVISLYATSLCYSAVAKNPNEECNPFLGEDDVLSIVIGVGLTVVSLGYAGWSITADKTMNVHNQPDQEPDVKANSTSNAGSERKVAGVVANQSYGATEGADNGDGADGDEGEIPNTFSNNWKLNILLGVVSCWYSMALTSWGSIQASGDVANPEIGSTSMWMIVTSQWIVLTLYLWTLVAPRLFPDRDFS